LDALGIITGFIKVINNTLDIVNNVLDFVFPWVGLVVILGYPVYFYVRSARKYNKEKKNNNKENKGGDLLSQTLILFVVAIGISFFWILPELIFIKWPVIIQKWPLLALFSNPFRLIEIALAFLWAAHHFGHEYGETRWSYSSIGHIAAIFFGFIVDRWAGIIFISLPLLTAYYFALYNLAIILLPASNPEDKVERSKRFNILASYTWGIQSPLIVADGNTWKTPETRIPGDFTWDFSDFPIPIIEKLQWRPGLIWTQSHQVAAITGGTKFKRVDGPGIIFAGALERAEQIFDLRLQIRNNEIDVVSKDGVSFKVRVFTAFRMDPEIWDKETYDALRPMNTILRGADKPSHTKGSFPYSNLRVQAALGITSTKAAEGNPTIYWDEWALGVVEDHARKVVSQKYLDELWRPADDKKFANALDKLANEIKENASLIFRTKGILLIVARIVNFRFTSDNNQIDEISKQQLATWGSEWERNRAKMLSKAQAESEHTQQEARAYAESLLLNSIADGLQKAKEIDPALPRYVIAMRFLSSLQDYVHKQPEEKNMQELENHFKEWQEQFFPKQGKEK
jgi:hypothetical protein